MLHLCLGISMQCMNSILTINVVDFLLISISQSSLILKSSESKYVWIKIKLSLLSSFLKANICSTSVGERQERQRLATWLAANWMG